MFKPHNREFDRDRNREVIPLEGIPLYRILETDKNLFEQVLKEDPDLVYRYHKNRKCYDIYYTDIFPDDLFWAEIWDPYEEAYMVSEVGLREYYVRYVPTMYEVKRALRGAPGSMGPSGKDGECKCDE